jgi:ankyrin repeat protein
MWAVPDTPKTRTLVERGANVNARSKEGRTPLLIAARQAGAGDTIRLLLAKGADANAADALGGTALMMAAEVGDIEMVRLFLERGADVNKQAAPLFGMPRIGSGPPGKLPENRGLTALLAAAHAGNLEVARVLVEKGADPNPQDLRGFSALMVASMRRDPELVRLLLDHGADVHAREFRKATPLILAASSDEAPADTVRLLLEKGADWKAKDAVGNTALDWAGKRGRTEVTAVLRRAAEPPAGDDAARVTDAVNRSLALLQSSSVQFTKKGGCISCHHQSILQIATASARARGFSVDEEAARHVLKHTAGMLTPHREPMLQGVASLPVSPFVSSYALVGMAVEGHPTGEITDALVIELAARQMADGRWRGDIERPPLGQGDITSTALTIRALQLYGPPGRRREFDERIRRAAAWLSANPGRTAQEKSMRVLGLAWAKSPAREAALALAGEQRPDGGWAQLASLESDAYATGMALYALYEAGAWNPADRAYRRGVDYLLESQQPDGSWHVRSRALGFQPQFDSGFPHGADQWISAGGSAWATLALTLTREPGSPLRASARR